MLFVRTTYLVFETFQILSPTASLIFTAAKLFHQVSDIRKNERPLRIHNGGCSLAKCLHFVMFYMEQNQKHKQTLESAQYGLEISFKKWMQSYKGH